MKYLLLLSIFLISSCTKEVIVSESEIREIRVNEGKERMIESLPPEFVIIEGLGNYMYIVDFRGQKYLWSLKYPNGSGRTEILTPYNGPVKTP